MTTPKPTALLTTADILRLVYAALEDTFHVPIETIVGPCRTAEISFIRHVGMLALMTQFRFPPDKAARAFQRTCRNTATHAAQTIRRHAAASAVSRSKIIHFNAHLARLRQQQNLR